MNRIISVLFLFGVSVFSIAADSGNISGQTENLSFPNRPVMSKDNNIMAMSADSHSAKNNTSHETQKSFYEYGNEKNRAEKKYTDYMKTADKKNIGVQDKAENLAWEATRQKQRMNDGEYGLSEESKTMAIGGMNDGEHSIKMGESNSLGLKDGTYDIGGSGLSN